ncbi:MAG: hypothetical protein WHX53_11175, partial [Anaerolineae bacterium]
MMPQATWLLFCVGRAPGKKVGDGNCVAIPHSVHAPSESVRLLDLDLRAFGLDLGLGVGRDFLRYG